MKVSVLVPTYGKNSQRYLNLALRSLKRQTLKDIEIVVCSSGEYKPEIVVDGIKHVHSDERLHFASATMKAYENSKPSDFVLLCNDDVILSKDCIENMVNGNELLFSKTIVNPLSNCDNGKLYVIPLGFNKNGETLMFKERQYKYEEMAHNFDAIVEASVNHSAMMIPVAWLAFYCTLIPRALFEDLGGLDIGFKSGQEDLSFSLLAKEKGYITSIATEAFCFHFGGVTASEALTDDDRTKNVEYFEQKHKGLKLR